MKVVIEKNHFVTSDFVLQGLKFARQAHPGEWRVQEFTQTSTILGGLIHKEAELGYLLYYRRPEAAHFKRISLYQDDPLALMGEIALVAFLKGFCSGHKIGMGKGIDSVVIPEPAPIPVAKIPADIKRKADAMTRWMSAMEYVSNSLPKGFHIMLDMGQSGNEVVLFKGMQRIAFQVGKSMSATVRNAVTAARKMDKLNKTSIEC